MAEDFAGQVRRWSDETLEKLNLVVRKSAMEAFAEVIRRSPVDTGRFRGNWQAGIGSAPAGVLATTDIGGGGSIARAQGVANGAGAGDVIVLANNLPYAERLEYGWSGQAPGGMVRLTAQRWQPIVNAMVAEVANG